MEPALDGKYIWFEEKAMTTIDITMIIIVMGVKDVRKWMQHDDKMALIRNISR